MQATLTKLRDSLKKKNESRREVVGKNCREEIEKGTVMNKNKTHHTNVSDCPKNTV